MPVRKRIKTQYPGVYYVESTVAYSTKPDKIYYIMYRKEGKLIEKSVGRQSQNNMSPSRAHAIRSNTIQSAKAIKEIPQEIITKRREEQGRWTVNRLWEAYESQREKTRSLHVDISRYRRYLKEPLGNKELKDLVPHDMDHLRIKNLKKKSPQTVKHILGLVKRLHNFAIRKNLAPGLSFVIKMPEVENKKTEDLTPEQLTALLRAIKESKHIIPAAMMKTALYTGMRRGELLQLQWDDIDFDHGFIVIREPGGRVNQKIPLNETTSQIFTALPRTSTYVFPGRGGRQRTTVTREVNSIKHAAGLPRDFRPLHGLRHAYASMLAGSGQMDMYTLQKLLTHKSPQMTQRYAHLREEAFRNAAELAGDIIEQVVLKEENKKKNQKHKDDPQDINQYDLAKKVINKNIKKNIEKKTKTAITKMKQLKIPGME